MNLRPTDLGYLQSPKLGRAAVAPAHLVSFSATCILQPQVPWCHRCHPWPGSSLRFTHDPSGILIGSGCLPLLVHVGAVRTPAKYMSWVRTHESELGHIPLQMETWCIGLWDKIVSQKPPSKSARGSVGLGRAAALGWVCVCPSCPGLAGGSRLFQSPRCCRPWGGCGDPALLQVVAHTTCWNPTQPSGGLEESWGKQEADPAR